MRDDIFNDCFEHWKNSDGKIPFWGKLAEKYGYTNSESMRAAFRRERSKRGVKKEREASREEIKYEQGDDYINIVCSSPRIKNKEELIDLYNIDMNQWRIEKYIIRTDEAWRKDRKVQWESVNGRGSGTVDDSGKILIVPLTRIELRLVPKTIDDITIDELGEMFSKKEFKIPSLLKKEYLPSDETLEVCITDLHFGSDANHEPEKRFEKAIDDVVSRIGKRKFDKIILAILSDIFHYDNTNKTTSSGTIVTTNGMTAYETYDLGLTSMLNVISKFVSIAPLEIIFVPGNHDRMTGYTLIKAIELYFKDTDKVKVDASHAPRKFQRIGVNLIGWMHGDMPKSRASNWLQVDAREEWGKTKYSEIHSGNFHSQSGKEDGGVILRYVPGLTDIDNWHNNNGYIGAVRAMVSFVWDKEKGLREQWFTIS